MAIWWLSNEPFIVISSLAMGRNLMRLALDHLSSLYIVKETSLDMFGSSVMVRIGLFSIQH